MIVNSYTIKQRMQGVGVMSEKLAKDLCVVGPVARGSNVPYDVRSAAPYLMYKEVKVTPIVEKDGDCWARSIVRVRELYQSIDLIRQLLPMLDGTPDELFAKSKVMPEGESFARVEPPRGELFYYVRGQKVQRAGPRKDTDLDLRQRPGHRSSDQRIAPCRRGTDHDHVRPVYRVLRQVIGHAENT